MNKDPFVPNPSIVPQHYPLWVEEWSDGHFLYYPIIGWVWRNDANEPYLHPVITEDVGAGPYEPRGKRQWSIADHKHTGEEGD